MKELLKNSVESSELVEQTFEFWFNNHEHIRSPFPDYIRPELKRKATDLFFQWSCNLKDEAKDEMNDEMVAEKFEEIIFETATSLVKTEEERLSILYPFLPRVGDQLKNEIGEPGDITDRWMKREGDHNFMWVTCENSLTKEKWNTSFELPV
ncbi:MAG: hypothetical protein EP319_00030 [Deltaproteobacteria bacterium]|nr:MAG: hypothetical protein EP319_00030 [Deltaproteobacteria bacterium]